MMNFQKVNLELFVLSFLVAGAALLDGQKLVETGQFTLARFLPGLLLGALLLLGKPRLWFLLGAGSLAAGWILETVFTPTNSLEFQELVPWVIQGVTIPLVLWRSFGSPINLNSWREFLWFFTIIGPCGCLIGSTLSLGFEFAQSANMPSEPFKIWVSSWGSAISGTVVLVPLLILNPWANLNAIHWARNNITRFPVPAFFVVVLMLSLSFSLWKSSINRVQKQQWDAFVELSQESEKAMLQRLESYANSLNGAVGLFHAQPEVSKTQWASYVSALDPMKSLPGVLGLGFIEAVPKDQIESFQLDQRQQGFPNFKIHPQTNGPHAFVIRLIEPFWPNEAALGLNISFEENRKQAALQSRDTGNPTITKRIYIAQDREKYAGFLLLHPVFHAEMPQHSQSDRRNALLGWIYAPFIGEFFWKSSIAGLGKNYELTIYDGNSGDPADMIFSSISKNEPSSTARFSEARVMEIFGQSWTVHWESTQAFEKHYSDREPVIVFTSGLALTALIAILAFAFASRERSIKVQVAMKTSELAARDQQNQSIVETAATAIVLTTGEGVIVDTNHCFDTMFGSSNTKTIGCHVGSLVSGLTESRFSEIQTNEKGAFQDPVILETLSGSGNPLFVEPHINQWVTETGETRFTLIIRDVTKEYRAIEELRSAEHRLDLALKGGRIAVVDFNPLTGKSNLDKVWFEHLGLPQNETTLIEENWLSLVHPLDLDQYKKKLRDCAQGASERLFSEHRMRHKRGHWIWVRMDEYVIERNAKGAPLRRIGTQIDISELKESAEALKTSEKMFRSAIEDAPVGMALLSQNGNWLKVNTSLCAFLNYEEEELRETFFVDLLLESASEFPCSGYSEEKIFIKKGGERVWGLLSASEISGGDLEERQYILQIQDIDAQKQADRLKSEFIATVSHELRTPLTSIQGSIGLIKNLSGRDPAQQVGKLLEIANSNCQRLLTLVEGILDLDQITTGAIDLELKVANLATLVENTVQNSATYATDRNVSFVIKPLDQTTFIRVDPDKFEQVLLNLLSNAAKFSPINGEVEIFVTKTEKTVRVHVKDAGPGIPEAFKDRIFSRFAQADSSSTRKANGAGLGLSIAKELIEKMSGQIGFENTAGSGATFWIEIAQEHPQELPVLRSA